MLYVSNSLVERAQATLDAFGSPAERRRPAHPRKAKPPTTGREAWDRLFEDTQPPPNWPPGLN